MRWHIFSSVLRSGLQMTDPDMHAVEMITDEPMLMCPGCARQG
jgi:hypothetical protein